MTRMRISLSFLSLFFLSHCASVPRQQPTGLKPTAFWNDQHQRELSTRLLSGRIHLRYKGKEESVSGKGILVSQIPEKLRMELRDPLGRVHYIVSLEDRDFVAHYPRRRLAYIDHSAGRAYLRKTMGIPLSFRDFQFLMVGLLPNGFDKKQFAEWVWDDKEGAYKGSLVTQQRKMTIWVDPNKGYAKKIELSSNDDQVFISYSDFAQCCSGNPAQDTQVAQTITVNHQKGNRALDAIDFDWKDIEGLKAPRATEVFRENLPQNTKRITLDG